MDSETLAPPRENLVRVLSTGFELRSAEGDAPPTMVGHFARFDEWAEIDSIFEGHFRERIAPGAFKKTFREQRNQIRVLFEHGQDPQVGMKPLGPIAELREDEEGAYYEVPLIDAPYVRETILPGLRAGLYGASFRFRITREDFDPRPERSDSNPDGIPERTIRELHLREFGPVVFPAYANADAAVRSLTDQFIFNQLALSPEQTRELLKAAPTPAPSEPDVAPAAPRGPERRDTKPRFRNREEFLKWISKT